MGEMVNQNERLRDQNESEQKVAGPLACYYADIFDRSSNTRVSLDLNSPPPPKKPLEGALVIMTTMFARPLERKDNRSS
jgi:hypothetical protein